ncbi:MAG: FHA domain-containing protein [Candidatus Latescibacteria bacterium]|nr:FHA domain-containing protein [Candidatus Latescibacterota bacterium]
MNVIILNGSDEGKQIELNPGKYVIGRSSSADIVIIDDRYVSSTHAELKISDKDRVTVNDLGSKNGTFLLGEPVDKPMKTEAGDIIRIGHTFLKLSRRSMERFFDQNVVPSEAPEAIVVVDIVGSSKIAQALGDRMASKVKNILSQNLNNNLNEHPAVFLKNTGDGYMVVFSSAMDAVRFSIKLMKDTMGDGAYKGFHIRIGIHYGETFMLPDGDRRGMAVDMAFRVESVKVGDMHQTMIGIRKDDLPRVDRIFISEVVQKLIPSHSAIKTRCIGFFDLKGFTGRHKLFEVLY